MLALLVLAVFASASADPISEKKILPVYEYPFVSKVLEPSVALKSWCLDDCHHHVLDKPVLIVRKGLDRSMNVQYYPLGLNSLGQSPLKKDILSGNMVAMVSPLHQFPLYMLDELNVTTPAIPEYTYKFSDIYKEAPVMVLLTKAQFEGLSKEPTAYTLLADFAVDDQGFSLLKEYKVPQETEPSSDEDSFDTFVVLASRHYHHHPHHPHHNTHWFG